MEKAIAVLIIVLQILSFPLSDLVAAGCSCDIPRPAVSVTVAQGMMSVLPALNSNIPLQIAVINRLACFASRIVGKDNAAPSSEKKETRKRTDCGMTMPYDGSLRPARIAGALCAPALSGTAAPLCASLNTLFLFAVFDERRRKRSSCFFCLARSSIDDSAISVCRVLRPSTVCLYR